MSTNNREISERVYPEALGQAVCIDRHPREALPALIEPQLTGISPLALGLEGYEEVKTPDGAVFYRQGWWCRMR